MKDHDRAILLFQQALALFRQAGQDRGYPYTNMLNNLSLTYREAGLLSPAITTLEQMLHLLETLPEHRNELAVTCSNLTSLHYAPGLNSLAGFLYACGDYVQALVLYRRSAKYIRRFYGETLDYAVTYQNMRWVYEKMGQQENAALALRKAANVYAKLFGHENERTRMVMDDLARLQSSRSHEVI